MAPHANHKPGAGNSIGASLGHATRDRKDIYNKVKEQAMRDVYGPVEAMNVTNVHNKSYDLKVAECLLLQDSLENCLKRERLATIDAKVRVDAATEDVVKTRVIIVGLKEEIAELRAQLDQMSSTEIEIPPTNTPRSRSTVSIPVRTFGPPRTTTPSGDTGPFEPSNAELTTKVRQLETQRDELAQKVFNLEARLAARLTNIDDSVDETRVEQLEDELRTIKAKQLRHQEERNEFRDRYHKLLKDHGEYQVQAEWDQKNLEVKNASLQEEISKKKAEIRSMQIAAGQPGSKRARMSLNSPNGIGLEEENNTEIPERVNVSTYWTDTYAAPGSEADNPFLQLKAAAEEYRQLKETLPILEQEALVASESHRLAKEKIRQFEDFAAQKKAEIARELDF